jgi:hypothetical protein
MKINLPIKNFPAQQSIFDSPARFKIACKGRRFGLTRGKANNFIYGALKKTYSKGLWVDTVNSNIDRYVERYFIPHLRLLPEGHWEWKKQAKTLYILNSYIDFRSADKPENIEGFGYDDVFLNEAGIILKNEYLWHNAIRPMLWDYNSPALIGGTPKGKGLFFELYNRGLDTGQGNYQAFHFTTFDNPYLPVDEIREEIKDMPERVVQQEIYAQFLEDTGVVFRDVRAVATATPQKPRSGHVYVMGVDLAKVQDWTVIAVYDRATNAQVYQDRFKTLEWPFQKKKIATIAQHFNNALVVIDATGIGDPIADDLARENISIEPFKLTNSSKKEIIEKLSIYIEQKTIKILNLEETIAEFNSFTYDITNSGRIIYEAPPGFHDDIVIAHALAVSSLIPLPVQVESEPVSLIREEYQRLTRKGNSDYEFIYSEDTGEEF